jgi:hypothetical protein
VSSANTAIVPGSAWLSRIVDNNHQSFIYAVKPAYQGGLKPEARRSSSTAEAVRFPRPKGSKLMRARVETARVGKQLRQKGLVK